MGGSPENDGVDAVAERRKVTKGKALSIKATDNRARMQVATPRPGEITMVHLDVRAKTQPRIVVEGGGPRDATAGVTVLGGSEVFGRPRAGLRYYAVTVPVLKAKQRGARTAPGSLRIRLQAKGLRVGPGRVFERAFSRLIRSEMCEYVGPLDLHLRHPKDRVDIAEKVLYGRMPRGFTDPDYLGGFAVQRACGVPGPDSFLTLMNGRSKKRVTSKAVPPSGSVNQAGSMPQLPAIDKSQGSTDAVLLVSGFVSDTPFMTPNCDASKAGGTWEKVFRYLQGAGYPVFAMPAGTGGMGCGEGAMPIGLDTKGDLDTNGERMAVFLNWMNKKYGIKRVWLVGHSDGGMWSRAAMDYKSSMPNLTFPLITTIDTPHTGSMMADVGIAARNTTPLWRCSSVQCTFQNTLAPIVRELEDELLPGPALKELTGTYTRSWNYRQRGVLTAAPETPIYTISGDGFTNNLFQLLGDAWDLDTGDGRYWYANDIAVGVSSQQGDSLQGDGIATVRCFPTQDDLHTETLDRATVSATLNGLGTLVGVGDIGDDVPRMTAITGDPQTMTHLDSALAGTMLDDKSCPFQTAGQNTTLTPGATLGSGESIDDVVYGMRLQMQTDGDLVLTGSDGSTWWRSGTNGNPGASAQFTEQGTFKVVSTGGTTLWSSGTWFQYGGATFQLRKDGFGIYYDDQEYFTSARRCVGTDKPTSIRPGDRLLTGHSMCSTDGRYILTMLPDGNLELSDLGNKGRRLWVSGTYGNDGVSAQYQADGNFVLYDGAGRAIWSTDTWNSPGGSVVVSSKRFDVLDKANASVWRSDRCPSKVGSDKPGTTLTGGQRLLPKASLCSNNGNYRLTMQSDGDLAFYDVKGGGGEFWTSQTYGNPGAYARMGDDGNFVVYNKDDKPLWASKTWGNDGAFLLVTEESKKFVIKLPNRDIWNSIKGPLN